MSMPLLLIAEDEPLIGIDWQDTLEGEGYAVAGPVRSCSDLLAALQDITPDVALLDYLLADGPCDAALRELIRRDIPVVICSGTAPAAEFAGVPLVAKPARIGAILAAVKAALQSRTARMVVGGSVMAGLAAAICFCEIGPHLHF
jgi:DNA-binding response OmpR family regulator